MAGRLRVEATQAERDEDLIAAGRAALRRAAWDDARTYFEAVIAGDPESAEGFEGLSWAAFWLGDADVLFEALLRAYRLYRRSGDRASAARVATWIGTDHVDFRGELAVADGWFRRARRLLDGLDPCPEHGWLSVHVGEKQLGANDTEGARGAGAYAAELGRRLGVIDLEVLGLATEGLALATEGSVSEGMLRLDEAAAAAFGGEVEEIWASAWCGCYMMYACERVRDYGRAAEWCRLIEDWSEHVGGVFLNRVCRAHYAGILVTNGAWQKAEVLLIESEQTLATHRAPFATEASVRLGELRRRQGRTDEAEEKFEAAIDHPLALIGLGEVCLDRGDAAGARDRAREYLRDVPAPSGTVRAAGLDLLARALAADGDDAGAAEAHAELRSIAEQVGTLPLQASAAYVAGAVSASRGWLSEAQAALEDSVRLFNRSGAPFEAARSRLELAHVFAQGGRERDALREANAAATSFRRIGAGVGASRTEALIAQLRRKPASETSPLTPREREVLMLISEGNGDRAIAERLVLSEHTVHRHVANILSKLACPSRSAAVAEALRQGLL